MNKKTPSNPQLLSSSSKWETILITIYSDHSHVLLVCGTQSPGVRVQAAKKKKFEFKPTNKTRWKPANLLSWTLELSWTFPVSSSLAPVFSNSDCWPRLLKKNSQETTAANLRCYGHGGRWPPESAKIYDLFWPRDLVVSFMEKNSINHHLILDTSW